LEELDKDIELERRQNFQHAKAMETFYIFLLNLILIPIRDELSSFVTTIYYVFIIVKNLKRLFSLFSKRSAIAGPLLRRLVAGVFTERKAALQVEGKLLFWPAGCI
jgi:hypothetical protein